MRLLVSWLRDFVDIPASTDEIAARLALCGFEVASVEPAPPDLRPAPWQTGSGPDGVIDLEITANRPDCLSVVGLAREVATAFDRPLTLPSRTAGARIALAATPIGDSDRLKVTLEDAELCPRYAAAVADVTPSAPSPAWMTTRLQAAGVRPISIIVDITNYVLLELGHPMHAFDLAKLAGAELRIRRAKRGETLRTLDGVDRILDPEMLVIADADRAQAVAGVMGGAASEVSASTRSVAFESAYFKPTSVRRTSKWLGLKTEASARFERGADINLPVVALERAIALMQSTNAGRPTGPIVDRYPAARQPARLHLRRSRLGLLLGASVPDGDVERILRGLGLEVSGSVDGWDAVAPTFRVDLAREADLIEEVGRHYGFDKLAPTFPPMTMPAPAADARIPRDRLVRRVLTAAGLSEAVTFGFIEAKAAERFVASGNAADVMAVANPLSAKFDALRPSLLPGLVDSVGHNRRHGARDVRLFEIGTRFRASAGESRGVGLAWTGAGSAVHWSTPTRDVDFFDVKGVAEQLCAALDVPIRFEPTRDGFLVAGRAASIVVGGGSAAGMALGVAGELAPAVAESRGLPRQDAVYVAELDLDALERARAGRDEAVAALARHPSVVRDLSIVIADSLPAEIIRGTIQSAGRGGGAPLAAVGFFDRYQGKGVPEGKISLSIRLTFQAADRTLTDAEVQTSFDQILEALVRQHGAVQR
jgi:phenylalanyl-tRNA synthetase beta chain